MRIGLTVLLVAATAYAQTPSTPASPSLRTGDAEKSAAEHYDRGVKLYDASKGDARLYEAALAEFEASYAAVPAFQVLFNIAVTQKKLGRFGEAMKGFQRYLKEGGAEVPAGRRETVEKEVGEIRALVAEVEVLVSGGAADLYLDGKFVAKTPLDAPLYLVSGNYVLQARRAGFENAEQSLRVVSGNRYEVKLSPVAKDVANLRVTSVPEGASLTLDGKVVGVAPWASEVAAGGHFLTAQLEGYDLATLELTLAAGQTREVSIELSQPTPLFKRWYVWAGIVAVVAAGGVTAYVATAPNYDYHFNL